MQANLCLSCTALCPPCTWKYVRVVAFASPDLAAPMLILVETRKARTWLSGTSQYDPIPSHTVPCRPRPQVVSSPATFPCHPVLYWVYRLPSYACPCCPCCSCCPCCPCTKNCPLLPTTAHYLLPTVVSVLLYAAIRIQVHAIYTVVHIQFHVPFHSPPTPLISQSVRRFVDPVNLSPPLTPPRP